MLFSQPTIKRIKNIKNTFMLLIGLGKKNTTKKCSKNKKNKKNVTFKNANKAFIKLNGQ